MSSEEMDRHLEEVVGQAADERRRKEEAWWARQVEIMQHEAMVHAKQKRVYRSASAALYGCVGVALFAEILCLSAAMWALAIISALSGAGAWYCGAYFDRESRT